MDIKIRDLRKKEQFTIDDEYLNGYARLCGINATGVYLSLCRHANFHTQTCFPSKKLMAEELDISERSVYRALRILEKWQIISSKGQSRKADGSYKNTVYTLLDKTLWRSKPVEQSKPSASKSYGYRLPYSQSPSAKSSISRLPQVPNKVSNAVKVTNKNVSGNFDKQEDSETKDPVGYNKWLALKKNLRVKTF